MSLQNAKLRAAEAFLQSQVKNNVTVQEIAFAMLYMGEGYKRSASFGLGNSNPQVMRFFVEASQQIYKVPKERFRCELYLRADQDQKIEKKYWSRQLKLPLSRFKFVSVDARTKGKPTYPDYHGVCSVRCGAVEIQRKVLYLGDLIMKLYRRD